MSYTVAELKVLTSIPAVSTMADAKILIYQSIAESILGSLGMDTTMAGYADAYNGALVLLFDMIAENPTGLSSSGVGKMSASYAVDDLPLGVRSIVSKFIKGNGSLSGAIFQRNDIGLR